MTELQAGGKELKAEAGTLQFTGAAARLTVTRGPESWQFFAFVFAATVTLVLGILDDIPWPWPWWVKTIGRVMVFGILICVFLVNVRVRNWLAGPVLKRFKEESR